MGLRKELSKRFSTSFRLRKSPNETTDRRFVERENSEGSALSVQSQHSESSTSLSSATNKQFGLRKRDHANWFFTEEFSHSFSENSVNPTKTNSKIGLGVQPVSTDDLLILPLWIISTKGLNYQTLRAEDEAKLKKLPQDCQNVLIGIHKKVTIYDYENSEKFVHVMHGLIDPTETSIIPARRRESKPKLAKPKSSKKVDKRAAFQQKRGVSTLFSTQVRNRSFERGSSRRAPIWWFDIENNKLDDHGIEATLVKAEIQLVGGSTILAYYVEVDCGQHDLSVDNQMVEVVPTENIINEELRIEIDCK